MAEGRYFLGSPKWLGVEAECSIVFLDKGQDPLLIDLKDRIRPEVKQLLNDLHCPIHLYSGDRSLRVQEVAKELGINHYQGEMSAQDKMEKIEELQKNGVVAFVGDGMNDAAAIAKASLSFVPLNGSDFSAQASDFLLTKEDLTLIPKARLIGKRGQQILKQNLFWAFFYNLIGIPLAFFGLLSPVLATSLMIISSLTVLLNSKRI